MTERYVSLDDLVVAPCQDACPAGIDVPRYIRAVKDGKYDEAVAVIREKIPFPVVCADACFAPCEDTCAYRQFGDPIAIRALKMAAVDRGGDSWKQNKKLSEPTGKKVAIVGSGPAGLTTAYYLASKGHTVTVYDALPEPGGMMRYGIPRYRVPEERLTRDIDEILDLGIEFKGETNIGKDISLDQLKEEFDAVFLASGANGSAKIPLEGAEKEGVLWGWDFLRDVRLGQSFNFNGDVIVIGGGNVAIDVALTAKRLGASNVHLFSLEDRGEMPAHEWEIARAEEEGVFINTTWAPKKVLGEDKVEGLGFIRCTSVFDDACNFNPIYDEDISHKFMANHVILAVGQYPDLEYLGSGNNIEAHNGRIEVDPETFATGEAGVYAGGDVVSGPQSIIDAIAHGRKIAGAIDKYLGGDGNIDEVLASPQKEILVPELDSQRKPRNEMRLRKAWQRTSGFDQVELGLTDEQIAAETRRCLYCDARQFEVILNTESCKECGYCAEVCGMNVFGPADYFNAKGYRPEEVKLAERCCGCFKCYFACPDFAIDIKEVIG
ncbi:MAG: FAD-dependent oxidoreductase [Desulfobacterales bacterium]|jgi:NADPH-dependent glutamate synthase beta subunit-like oxidoreductase/NAD-dependent dihydropyrimidine dehydrogenase PreA subunit